MEGLIETFHIDWKLLLAQVVNFAIVVAVLYKFAYKPLLKAMNERTGKIEKGLKNAQKAQRQLEEAEKEKEEKLLLVKKEARKILEEAYSQAEKSKAEIMAETQDKALQATEKAKEQIQAEKDKMLQEAKTEIGQLVLAATEKILEEKLDAQKDKELIEKTVKSTM